MKLLNWFEENRTNIILPNIQRNFEWTAKQVEDLFDSIYRGFPIGTFWIWNNEKAVKEIGAFKINYAYTEGSLQENIVENYKNKIAILDGQQRLTALAIGLYGTYNNKILYCKINGNKIEKFKFKDKKNYGEEWKKIHIDTNEKETLKKNLNILPAEFKKNLNKLEFVSQEVCNDVSDTSQIFIRLNSKGTKLTPAFLLFSKLISGLKSEKKDLKSKEMEPRQIVKKIINTVNTNEKINIKIDYNFIIKACLFCSNPKKIKSVRINKDLFKDKNTELLTTIFAPLDSIDKNIKRLLECLKDLGFYGKTLLSHNAIIPLLYLVINNKLKTNKRKDKDLIKYYMLSSLLKGVYGSSSDTTLDNIRKQISDKNFYDFKKDLLKHKDMGFFISDDNISDFIKLKYGNNRTLPLLMFLCNEKAYNELHIDHLHAKKFFDNKTKYKEGLTETNEIFITNEVSYKLKKREKEIIDKNKKYLSNSNYNKDLSQRANSLVNLSLLPGEENTAKNDKPLINSLSDSKDLQIHNIPKDAPLHLKYCGYFFDKREELIKENLKKKFRDLLK